MELWILNGRAGEGSSHIRFDLKESGTLPGSGRTCIIFVHGFNKDVPEALGQARRFFGLLQDQWDWSTRRVRFSTYLWPATRQAKSLLSGFKYPQMIDPAKRSGRMLGEHLSKHHPGLSVVLVGHSLGALVAAEAALRMRKRDEPSLRVLLLTGAAVESRELEHLGDYQDRLAHKEAVLFCTSDVILKHLFGLGQRFAHPFRRPSDAVGLTGLPTTRAWDVSLRTNIWDHRYWDKASTAETTTRLIESTSSSSVTRQSILRKAPTRDIY